MEENLDENGENFAIKFCDKGDNMVLFLRNKAGESILDLDIYTKADKDGVDYIEVCSTVDIPSYTKLLYAIAPEKWNECSKDFGALQEIRGWLWEYYFGGKRNTSEYYNEVLNIVRIKVKEIGNKYDLQYVED